jgi:hypothetical protein
MAKGMFALATLWAGGGGGGGAIAAFLIDISNGIITKGKYKKNIV